MTRLLQIALLGHPILRKKAKVVENFEDTDLQQLIADMMATVLDMDGVGIAAPQVYQNYRVFIMASHPNPRYPNAPEMAPTAIINPKIMTHSQEMEKDWEGCLSLPGVRALVPRYVNIAVEYQTREGMKEKAHYDHFLARIFQHELDHLDGKVFLDRLDSNKDIFMEKEYQKIISKKK